jgi:hypothetical protein
VGAADRIPSNTDDSWLHFGLGIARILLGIAAGRPAARAVQVV